MQTHPLSRSHISMLTRIGLDNPGRCSTTRDQICSRHLSQIRTGFKGGGFARLSACTQVVWLVWRDLSTAPDRGWRLPLRNPSRFTEPCDITSVPRRRHGHDRRRLLKPLVPPIPVLTPLSVPLPGPASLPRGPGNGPRPLLRGLLPTQPNAHVLLARRRSPPCDRSRCEWHECVGAESSARPAPRGRSSVTFTRVGKKSWDLFRRIWKIPRIRVRRRVVGEGRGHEVENWRLSQDSGVRAEPIGPIRSRRKMLTYVQPRLLMASTGQMLPPGMEICC